MYKRLATGASPFSIQHIPTYRTFLFLQRTFMGTIATGRIWVRTGLVEHPGDARKAADGRGRERGERRRGEVEIVGVTAGAAVLDRGSNGVALVYVPVDISLCSAYDDTREVTNKWR